MESLFFVLLGIITLFFVLLIAKNLSNKIFCVICGAVTLTWITLLVLYWKGIFTDIVVIALLMGESSLAIYYLFDAKAKEEWKFFRLPLLLSLVTFSYFLITLSNVIQSLFFLIGLWVIFLIIYAFRYKSVVVESFMSSVMECCKRW